MTKGPLMECPACKRTELIAEVPRPAVIEQGKDGIWHCIIEGAVGWAEVKCTYCGHIWDVLITNLNIEKGD